MMIVKKLIALVILVGLLTTAIGCPGTPSTVKTSPSGTTTPSGGDTNKKTN
jgi:hypothetical protein